MIHQQYKIIFLLLFTVSTNILLSQNRINLNLIGNKYIESSQYQKWVNAKSENISDSLVIPFIINKITTELNNYGLHQIKINTIRIDSIKTKQYFVTLNINEGEQAYIKSIKFNSVSKVDSIILDEFFNPIINQPFSKTLLEEQIEKVLNYYENNGYPFATIKIASIYFDTDKTEEITRIHLIINKKNLSKIDKIDIKGNAKTESRVIVNTLRFEKGELYSQNKIDNVPNKLNKLRFFKSVGNPKYFVNSDGEGILEVSLEEKNTNSFDGIIGYVPSTDNIKGYLTGFVNVSLRNLFGTGRNAAIKWQQETSQTQELELKYLEPWLFNYPFNLEVGFYQRKQDSTYVKRSYRGNLEFLATENISASFILESESVIPSINKNNTILVFNASSLNSGLQLKLDYRDDIFAPTKGLYFISLYKFRSKTVNNNEPGTDVKINFNNYELDFGGYYSFFKNQVLALGLHAKEIIGDNFDISDYYQFGGANTLRGYRENQFLGNRILWSNLEYRFMLSLQSYVFGFYDLGYFLLDANKESNIKRLSDYKFGYGVGLSLETGLGIMKVSYAFSEGSTITNGLIHFGLVNEF